MMSLGCRRNRADSPSGGLEVCVVMLFPTAAAAAVDAVVARVAFSPFPGFVTVGILFAFNGGLRSGCRLSEIPVPGSFVVQPVQVDLVV